MLAKQPKYLPYFMWAFPLLFFAYQFILRLWPGLMMQQIMEQFSIDASHFGIISALMYYGYAGMQIPVAILLDKFSARYIIFIFAVLCGVATFTFTYTDNWYIACISRFLVGVGSAVGFLGTSKVISEWFPKEQYAKMIGLSFTFGFMGAIFGSKPISILIENYSWQKVALTLSIVSVIIGCSAYLFLCSAKDNKAHKQSNQFKFSNFKKLLSSPSIWLIAFANFLMVGSLEGFAAGADLVNTQLLGVTIAFLNCINMLGGSFFHTAIGRLMDIFWTGTIMTDDNIRQYSVESYSTALMAIPICSIFGASIYSRIPWL